CQHNYGIPFTF
nr:immunoglobulin light chain junction region [Macaca mulatta]MOW73007.1 immunoglobulin light chain junction region [Macaca mulatta]MOW73043.1 immunoglobulin light chain junction region [Macaca mulatta]MOW73048.1 immunoglobulin light chain junction region [Macaca mulatta]MOW73254.1 immunoglobulin light chain junction region [Macaca mulatta]